jgi:hypothetical protein
LTIGLVDTSVVITWFHATGESELGAARALRDANVTNQLDAQILDLALYEVGNVIVRSLGWRADDVADQLDVSSPSSGARWCAAPSGSEPPRRWRWLTA